MPAVRCPRRGSENVPFISPLSDLRPASCALTAHSLRQPLFPTQPRDASRRTQATVFSVTPSCLSLSLSRLLLYPPNGLCIRDGVPATTCLCSSRGVMKYSCDRRVVRGERGAVSGTVGLQITPVSHPGCNRPAQSAVWCHCRSRLVAEDDTLDVILPAGLFFCHFGLIWPPL